MVGSFTEYPSVRSTTLASHLPVIFPRVLVRPSPLKVETREVKERTVTVRWTPVFDGGRPITSYRIEIKNKQGKSTRSQQSMTRFGH